MSKLAQSPFRESTWFENAIDNLIFSIGPNNFIDAEMQEADRLNQEYAKAETEKWEDNMARNAKPKDGGFAAWWRGQSQPDPYRHDDKDYPSYTPEEQRYRREEKHYDRPEDTGPDPEIDSTLNNSPENDRPRQTKGTDAGAEHNQHEDTHDARNAAADADDDLDVTQTPVEHIRDFYDQPDNMTQQPVDPAVGYRNEWPRNAAHQNLADPVAGRHVDGWPNHGQDQGWRGIDDGIRGNGAPNHSRPNRQTGEANNDLSDDTDATRKPDTLDNIFGAAGDRLPAPGVEPGRHRPVRR